MVVSLESLQASQAKVFRVKFEFDQPENTSMIEDGSQGGYVSVTVDKAGISSDNGFRLSLGGKRTRGIHPNATDEELEGIFSQLFTTECRFSQDTGK